VVVGVDEQRCADAGARPRDHVERGHDFRRLEQHRRHQHARRAIVDDGGETLGQRVRGPRRHLDDCKPRFAKAIDLPADGVELTVRGDELRAFRERQRRQQPRHQLVSVLPQRDLAAAIVEQPPKSVAHKVGLLPGASPFLVDELGRVEPRALLRVEGDVGPGLVRVAGQQQPLGDAEAGIMRGQHN